MRCKCVFRKAGFLKSPPTALTLNTDISKKKFRVDKKNSGHNWLS